MIRPMSIVIQLKLHFSAASHCCLHIIFNAVIVSLGAVISPFFCSTHCFKSIMVIIWVNWIQQLSHCANVWFCLFSYFLHFFHYLSLAIKSTLILFFCHFRFIFTLLRMKSFTSQAFTAMKLFALACSPSMFFWLLLSSFNLCDCECHLCKFPHPIPFNLRLQHCKTSVFNFIIPILAFHSFSFHCLCSFFFVVVFLSLSLLLWLSLSLNAWFLW